METILGLWIFFCILAAIGGLIGKIGEWIDKLNGPFDRLITKWLYGNDSNNQ